MYLGPVVVAQQVLDPTPQTSYPRKEKKGGGGGTSATTKAFYGGVTVDQMIQACHWKAHNTFANFT